MKVLTFVEPFAHLTFGCFFSLQVLGGVLQSLTEEAQKWRNGLGLGSAVASKDDGYVFFMVFVRCIGQVFLPMKHRTRVGLEGVALYVNWFQSIKMSRFKWRSFNYIWLHHVTLTIPRFPVHKLPSRQRSHIPPVPPVKGDVWVFWKVKSVNRPEPKITGTLKCYMHTGFFGMAQPRRCCDQIGVKSQRIYIVPPVLQTPSGKKRYLSKSTRGLGVFFLYLQKGWQKLMGMWIHCQQLPELSQVS